MRASQWNSLAEHDPMWAILSDPTKRGGRWDKDEFFANGEREIANAMQTCAELRLPEQRGLAVDFGCGVGRLTRALAARFEKAIGIDVSHKMVEQARHHNADLRNCEFIANESNSLPLPDSSADLVYTVLVLQHLSSKAQILAYISEFVRVLRPGGLAVFQLPVENPFYRRRLGLRPRLFNLLGALGVSHASLYRIGLHPMTVRGIDPENVGQHLAQFPDVEIRLRIRGWHAEPPGFIYFVAKRQSGG